MCVGIVYKNKEGEYIRAISTYFDDLIQLKKMF